MPQSTISAARWRSAQYWVPATLFVLAVVLVLNPLPFHDPVPAAPPFPAWAIDRTPVRQPDLQPDYRVAVFTYQCNDCHAIIRSPSLGSGRSPTQHREIVLEHGINADCLNCHHRTDRNAFAGEQGEVIPWDQPQLLCAKCHGPVYRDWQHGSHGRTNGYWDPSRGPRVRRKCIECHDPHRPPFPALQPAPPPHTLRIGPQQYLEHSGRQNPLRLGETLRRPGPNAEAEARATGEGN